MAVANPLAHTDAVVAAVDAAVSVPVGDGETPATLPHVAVYAVDGGSLSGSIGDPDDDIDMPFRVICAAEGDLARKAVQWLQHATRVALLDQTITVAGRSLFRVTLESPGGVRRDDDLGEAGTQRFYSSDLFHLSTVP